MMAPGTRQRLDRGARHLHALGARALAEFLAETADHCGGAACILDRLTEYGRVSPAMVRVAGGDRFPTRPLRTAPGERA